MLTSLSIEHDPIDQPAATDPVERHTWCAFRIRIGGRTVTRIWDRALGEERSFLYVPGFPIAEWIVSNWWTLLNESSRTERLPSLSAARSHLSWIRRHCLRSAESGCLLPALYLFNDGHAIRAEWQADERDALPNMPGEFIDSGFHYLDADAVANALGRFVQAVLGRVIEVHDDRVEDLKANWQAIQEADSDEVLFCIAAGRMGVDPYDRGQADDAFVAFIEHSLGNPEVPLVRDLTEVAEARSVAPLWSWVRETAAALGLGPLTRTPPIQVPTVARSPADLGYQLANAVRSRAHLRPSEAVPSVEAVAQAVAGTSFHSENRNHLPGRGVHAVVGWTNADGVFVAGPTRARPEQERFRLARALYHALFGCSRSERLVTDAHTWDQQASRAFAAELLAPRSAVFDRTGHEVDRSRVEALADEFQASPVLIRKQLENAGVNVIED